MSLPDEIAKRHETLTGSSLYRYTVAVYDYLHDNSELNEYGERVFVGSVASVINDIATSKRYYTPIRRLLESPPNDPCVEIRQRGTGKQPSIIRLFHPPPAAWSEIPLLGLTRDASHATLSESARASTELVRRVESLENKLGEVNLVEVLQDYKRRLEQLEGR